MNRRSFLLSSVAVAVGLLTNTSASEEMRDEERELFGESLGIAHRRYVGETNPDNPAYIYDKSEVTLYYEWYSILFGSSDIARSTFNSWADRISDSGNPYKDDKQEHFPIGEYDSVDYALIRPEGNSAGGLDMEGSWSLHENGVRTSTGGLHLLQTGSLVTIFWIHADKPDKCHITYIGKQTMDILLPTISDSAPQGGETATEGLFLGFLPSPDIMSFDTSVVTSVEIEKEWVEVFLD